MSKIRFKQAVIYSAYAVAASCLQTLYRMLRIKAMGVQGIVLNQQGQVLLVKHTYMPGWYIPGGGIKRKETAEEAVIRELDEEVGVKVAGPMEQMKVYFRKLYGNAYYQVVYIVRDFQQEPRRCFEIAESAWFDLDDLPEDTVMHTRNKLAIYQKRFK